MKKIIISSILLFTLWITGGIVWQELQAQNSGNQEMIDQMLDKYRKEGAKDFDPRRAEELWARDVGNKKKSCTDCHGTDLTKAGSHIRTGKVIDPMAAWVAPERYTQEKKIEKWFKQNCRGTWGRDCTPQEKGDFLTYFRAPLNDQDDDQDD